jgi:hypothetical protein
MSGPHDEAANPETPLTDPQELLFRQVHPRWVEDGVPSSQAFAPTAKDEGMLSIARGSMTNPEAAHKHYTTVQQLQSAGTWAVTVGEASALELSSFDDPMPDVPAHGFIDFRDLGRKQSEKRGRLLAARARSRGRMYP